MTTFVIVGGGLAGAKAAETLRAEGFDGEIVLFGDETERPYERPALAKGYLLGKDERESLFVHAADWYPEHGVDLRLGAPVTSINRAVSGESSGCSARRSLSIPSAFVTARGVLAPNSVRGFMGLGPRMADTATPRHRRGNRSTPSRWISVRAASQFTVRSCVMACGRRCSQDRDE